MADRLAEVLRNEKTVRRLNFSFDILPPISKVLRRAPKVRPPEGTRGSGMMRPLSAGKAAVLAVWYGVDHVLGHLVLHRRGEVLVFARSYHDFLYQRAYLRVPRIIPRLFVTLGPRPDIIAVSRRDPVVINEGKPELTVQEISRQYARISRELGRYPPFVEIDATNGIDDTVRQILEKCGL